MKEHHTKEKGDLGLAKAYADLVSRGYRVFFSHSEHLPFDLAVYKNGKFTRVQVKYVKLYNGTIRVRFTSTWVDRDGVHHKPVDKSEVDVYCVYCPETDRCYYLDPKKFGIDVSLRIDAAKNNQSNGVKLADDYLDF